MLSANVNHVGKPGTDIKKYLDGEARFRAYRMMLAIDIYLVARPRMPPFGVVNFLDANRRVERRELVLDCPGEQRAQVLH